MRISELSRSSGVPVATIKFYLREGLLPDGLRTSQNQAQYDDAHVQRLRLIRALVGAGGLSLAATKNVLRQIDEPAACEASRTQPARWRPVRTCACRKRRNVTQLPLMPTRSARRTSQGLCSKTRQEMTRIQGTLQARRPIRSTVVKITPHALREFRMCATR